MIGIVAFSFALGKNEPNPCNIRLASAVELIVRESKEPVILVAQWEIARAIKSVPVDYVVEKHRTEGAYLDSEEVMAQAAEFFRKHGVKEVIPVANPFLHLAKCRSLVYKEGFVSINRRIGWVGFYRKSLQWWTRGPIRLIVYAILQKFTSRRGK